MFSNFILYAFHLLKIFYSVYFIVLSLDIFKSLTLQLIASFDFHSRWVVSFCALWLYTVSSSMAVFDVWESCENLTLQIRLTYTSCKKSHVNFPLKDLHVNFSAWECIYSSNKTNLNPKHMIVEDRMTQVLRHSFASFRAQTKVD